MGSITTVLDRNRQFAADRHDAGLTILPRLGMTVIGCLDPRVDPAHVLGLDLGDAAVIRNVGGRVTPAALELLALLALGFPAGTRPAGTESDGAARKAELVVLHHVQCGITRMQKAPGALATYFGIAESELAAKAVADPRAAVAVDVAALVARPDIAAAYCVTGLVYDVTTGTVEVVVGSEVAV